MGKRHDRKGCLQSRFHSPAFSLRRAGDSESTRREEGARAKTRRVDLHLHGVARGRRRRSRRSSRRPRPRVTRPRVSATRECHTTTTDAGAAGGARADAKKAKIGVDMEAFGHRRDSTVNTNDAYYRRVSRWACTQGSPSINGERGVQRREQSVAKLSVAVEERAEVFEFRANFTMAVFVLRKGKERLRITMGSGSTLH